MPPIFCAVYRGVVPRRAYTCARKGETLIFLHRFSSFSAKIRRRSFVIFNGWRITTTTGVRGEYHGNALLGRHLRFFRQDVFGRAINASIGTRNVMKWGEVRHLGLCDCSVHCVSVGTSYCVHCRRVLASSGLCDSRSPTFQQGWEVFRGPFPVPFDTEVLINSPSSFHYPWLVFREHSTNGTNLGTGR